jgi:hypothetical protein
VYLSTGRNCGVNILSGFYLLTMWTELTELSLHPRRAEEPAIDSVDRTIKRIGTLVDADRAYVLDVDQEVETLID